MTKNHKVVLITGANKGLGKETWAPTLRPWGSRTA